MKKYIIFATALLLFSGCTPSMNAGEEEKTVINFEKEVFVNKQGDLYTVPKRKIMQVLALRGNIPALNDAKFVSKEESASFLKGGDVIIGLNRGGVIKAYPVKILRWHQIVNEKIGDELILVSYDPISDMAAGYIRRVLNETVTFRVSDKAYNSNPLLEDKETKTKWSQFMGTAIFGRLSGQVLEEFPLTMVTWDGWKKAFPSTEVLSIDTGHTREYDNNIYDDYYKADYLLFEVENLDKRYDNKKHVYGVKTAGGQKAYPADLMKKGFKLEDEIGGVKVSIAVDENGLFSAMLSEGGESLPVRRPLWFSWAAFYPKTELYDPAKK